MRNLKVNNNLYYDNDIAGMLFDERFKHIQGDSWLYTNYDQLSSVFNKGEFFIINYDKTDKRNINKLKVYLSEYIHYNTYIKQYDLCDLISEFLVCGDLDDLERLLNDYNINYSKAYDVITVREHSQGDTAQIFINLKEFYEVEGTVFKSDDYQDYFENLFYNSPIQGDINISFYYTTRGGINHTLKIVLFVDMLLTNEYYLSFDYDCIIDTIQSNLIQYNLNCKESASIYEILNRLTSTDVEV